MAKQYICKVCGYVHTGDKAPSVCPQCQQTDCFEPVKSKGLDTNSNVYTIIYAAVVVVIVAVLLAVISQVLSPRQEANKRLDVQKQILTALNVNYDKADPAALYDEYVKEDEWDGKPVFYATIDNNNYTVLPLKGQGLWGGIWGYIALEDDLNTVYGINFGHESVYTLAKRVLHYLDNYRRWKLEHPAFSLLVQSIFVMFFTWLLFRKSPRKRCPFVPEDPTGKAVNYNFPEILTAQIFVLSQLQLVNTVWVLVEGWFVPTLTFQPFAFPNIIAHIIIFIDYQQLFGKKWYSTLWRTVFCVPW